MLCCEQTEGYKILNFEQKIMKDNILCSKKPTVSFGFWKIAKYNSCSQ